MPVNPKFIAARELERRHRDLAHLRALCWFPLRRYGGVFTRTPLVPFTRRHRIELDLARNAFVTPGAPILLGDVFLFLWRLHPRYRAARPGREQLLAHLDRAKPLARFLRLWRALGSLSATCLHRRLTRCVRRADLFAATGSINAFLDIAYQDAPGSDAEGAYIPAAAARHVADNRADWLMSTYHLTHEQALDFPLALEHQLMRERALQLPDGELNVFAPSDLLLGS